MWCFKRFARDIKQGLLIGWTIALLVALVFTIGWFVTSFPIIGSIILAFLVVWSLGWLWNELI